MDLLKSSETLEKPTYFWVDTLTEGEVVFRSFKKCVLVRKVWFRPFPLPPLWSITKLLNKSNTPIYAKLYKTITIV